MSSDTMPKTARKIHPAAGGGKSVRARDAKTENGMQLLSLPSGKAGRREMLIQIHDVLQAVEVGGAIGAPHQMIPDPSIF